jgi:predicted trehalose synthase
MAAGDRSDGDRGKSAGRDGPLAAAVAGRLPQARWFAEKGRAVTDVRLADLVPLADGLTLGIVAVTVTDDTGHDVGSAAPAVAAFPTRYATVLEPPSSDDVAVTPAFARWLIHTIATGAEFAGRAGRLVGRPIEGAWIADAGPTRVRPLGVDASNTSFRVHCGPQDLAVKLLRRCRAGIQPEVEVGAFLATAAPWFTTPHLRGWLEYIDEATGDSTAVATLHDFAAGRVGGWDRLLELATAGGLGGPHGDRMLAIVTAIGRATAQMHEALTCRPHDPAFAAHRATRDDLRAIAATLADHARRVLGARAAPLVARFEALPSHWSPLPLVRVHGDYHLGQVLLSEDPRLEAESPLVIDFEGEPSRSLADRRRKQPAAKDVAGMKRSFDYLLRAAAAAGGPAWREGDLRRLEAEFFVAYQAVLTEVQGDWWPSDRVLADRLVEAFTIDKAIYELDYERRNRPAWVAVPQAAVETFLQST